MNIKKYFGLEVEIRKKSDPDTFGRFRKLLSSHVAPNRSQFPDSEYEIYIENLQISYKQKHFGVEGIENRLAQFDVLIKLTKKMVASGDVQFVDLGVTSNPNVPVNRTTKEISYQLTSNYILMNSEYTDYVALAIQRGTRLPTTNLPINIYAQATRDYAKHLSLRGINLGTVVTKLTFNLNRDLQLMFP
jgi:hypothetical protein